MTVAVGAEVLLKCIVTANPQPEGERPWVGGVSGASIAEGLCMSLSHQLSHPLGLPELCGGEHAAQCQGGDVLILGAPLLPCLPPTLKQK